MNVVCDPIQSGIVLRLSRDVEARFHRQPKPSGWFRFIEDVNDAASMRPPQPDDTSQHGDDLPEFLKSLPLASRG